MKNCASSHESIELFAGARIRLSEPNGVATTTSSLFNSMSKEWSMTASKTARKQAAYYHMISNARER
jgi:hypothetical protein